LPLQALIDVLRITPVFRQLTASNRHIGKPRPYF
jgi:hypothetical protein